MTDAAEEKTVAVNYSANSKTAKKASAKAEKPKDDEEIKEKRVAKPIVTGKVVQKKTGLGTKFREAFTGDSATSVGDYILFDVMLPAAKAMLSDAVSQGIDRLLFGGTRGGSSSRSSSYRSGHTNYSSYSKRDRDERREISRSDRATHRFDDIILETRAEAEEVVATLVELVKDYGVASVEDLYDCVDITADFTDAKWGWTDLRDVDIRRVRDGYRLLFPKPSFIE